MKILSPVSQVNEVEKLIQAGADELYCGVMPSEWPYKAFSINRRQDREDNFQDFDELRECIKIAHLHKIPVYLTLNEHYYTDEQYAYIMNYIREAIDSGIDGLIIADVALLITLREQKIGIPIHISTGGTTFNSACARFYLELGAERVILPRHLNINEIRQIALKVPSLSFEVFILNSKCHNVDGFCTFHHGLSEVVDRDMAKEYRNGCMVSYDIQLASPVYREEELKRIAPMISKERQCFWKRVHIDSRPCGACALYEFQEMGIYGVKIVGRKNSTLKKVVDVEFIKKCLCCLANPNMDRVAYIKWTQQLYRSTYGYPCRSYMCYYPQVNPSWNMLFSFPKQAT